MKLPNGYGSVYKLGGNRRNPWTVRVTAECTVDDYGKHYKYKYLGYYPDKTEALAALASYNSSPYNIDSQKITFSELYKEWSEEHSKKVSASNTRTYNAAYNACSPLYDIQFREIRRKHLQNVVDTCEKNYPTL
ncbi:MAG: site-specific integrase, partial [Eubacteriales bacterium]|nr:site-specific integrase [Eubacteriales bacterium]